MKIEARLSKVASWVEIELDKILPTPDGEEANLYRAMRYATLGGGKRLRPFLLIQTGNLFGVSDTRLIGSAIALELVHCYSLIHDDLPCMDDDDYRRGKPTVHRAFGEATAVLAGDALLTLAFEVLARGDEEIDPRTQLRLVTELAKAAGANGMVGGQMIDISGTENLRDPRKLERMQQLKTGALFRFAVIAGCEIGEASDLDIESLTIFASKLGLAFQIADDIADVMKEQNQIRASSKNSSREEFGNFASIFGIEEAKKRKEALIQDCKLLLNRFEGRGSTLSESLDYLVK